MTTNEGFTPEISQEPPISTTEAPNPQSLPTTEAPNPQALPTTEALNPQEDAQVSLSTPQHAQGAQESAIPTLPDHLKAEFEDVIRKHTELTEFLHGFVAPHREMLHAMEQEKKRYNAWFLANSHTMDAFQDFDSYASSRYTRHIETRDAPNMGRGFFTTAPIKKGDLLLAEKALVSSPMQDEPLAASLLEMFASSWNLTKELLNTAPSWQAIAAQMYNAHAEKSSHLQERLKQIQEASPETFPNVSLEALARWIGIIQSNAFIFRFNQRKCLGLYPLASIINHSCEPNAFFSFDGKTIFIHAKTEIPEDTQVFHSYLGDSSLLIEERQQKLQRGFNFACRCVKCTSEMDSVAA